MASINENGGRKPADVSRDARQRQDVSLKVNTLATQIVSPGDTIDTSTPVDVLFLAGSREKLTIVQACRITSMPGGYIQSLTVARDVKGVVLNGLELGSLIINTNATVTLTGCKIGSITVANMATVLLHGCATSLPVNIAGGGKAHAVATAFVGTSSLLNAGAAANVYSIGCSRQSGVAHTNTTIIAETT